jgi:hypothetical protein
MPVEATDLGTGRSLISFRPAAIFSLSTAARPGETRSRVAFTLAGYHVTDFADGEFFLAVARSKAGAQMRPCRNAWPDHTLMHDFI